MTTVIHICSDSTVLPFDNTYSEVLTAPKNKPPELNSSYNKTGLYHNPGVSLQWTFRFSPTVIHSDSRRIGGG